MEIINLDMTPSTVTPNAHAGQYDASRTIRFMLKNGGVPFTLAGTETITAEITRSDNTEVTVNVENTSSNYVDVVFDDTVCTVKGLYACELRLKDSDGFDIGSKNFALLVQRDPYDSAGIHVVTVGPADICTFETTLPEPLQSVLVNVLATGGNGTPDNPNPINGYTEANITRCGVNLFDKTSGQVLESFISGTIQALNVCRTVYVKCNPSTQYTVSKTAGQHFVVGYTKEMPANGVTVYGAINNGTASNLSITTGADAKYIVAMVYNGNVDSGTADEMLASVQIAEGTDTTYHPYTGNTYTIAFGQTVYGGVLDVTRGKLHVTHKKETYNGSEAWATIGTNVYYIAVPSEYQVSQTPKSNMYEGVAPTFYNTLANGKCALSTVLNNLLVHDDNITSLSDWQTALGNKNLEILYELATPFDIDLTPEVISAVVGENNVFADCGETTVKYLKAGD